MYLLYVSQPSDGGDERLTYFPQQPHSIPTFLSHGMAQRWSMQHCVCAHLHSVVHILHSHDDLQSMRKQHTDSAPEAHHVAFMKPALLHSLSEMQKPVVCVMQHLSHSDMGFRLHWHALLWQRQTPVLRQPMHSGMLVQNEHM
jgi:hypothetical protein